MEGWEWIRTSVVGKYKRRRLVYEKTFQNLGCERIKAVWSGFECSSHCQVVGEDRDFHSCYDGVKCLATPLASTSSQSCKRRREFLPHFTLLQAQVSLFRMTNILCRVVVEGKPSQSPSRGTYWAFFQHQQLKYWRTSWTCGFIYMADEHPEVVNSTRRVYSCVYASRYLPINSHHA